MKKRRKGKHVRSDKNVVQAAAETLGTNARIQKLQTLPEKYSKSFLSRMDCRLQHVKQLRFDYSQICNDLGGEESLSQIKRIMVEKFVWLSAILRGVEREITEGNKEQAAEMLGRWVQGLNSLVGLARSLGMEKVARRCESLETYVAKKSRSGRRSK